MSIIMRINIPLVAATLVLSSMALATPSKAQEVTPLEDVIGSMTPAEVAAMSQNGALTGEVDAVIDGIVADAIAEGVITADQAEETAATLSIVTANAEFFEFDIVEVINRLIVEVGVPMPAIQETLDGFNRLSDAGKALVGSEDWNDDAVGDRQTDADSLFVRLSPEDQAIVLAHMPVLTVTQDDAGLAEINERYGL